MTELILLDTLPDFIFTLTELDTFQVVPATVDSSMNFTLTDITLQMTLELGDVPTIQLGGGSGGTITGVTTVTGELIQPFISDGVLDWRIVGYSAASADIIVCATGESLQAFVTNGDEGAKFIEWRIL
jgi:hypothetical protein